MSVSTSDGAKPGAFYWAKVAPVWHAISIYDGPTTFLQQFRSVQPQVGHLFAAHWCQAEVYNGAFYQLFLNSTGVLAPEAVAGFRAIGMPRIAAVVADAMRFFGLRYPRDKRRRWNKLPPMCGENRADWDPFFELNQPFIDLLGTEAGGFVSVADRYSLTFRSEGLH